MKQSIGRLSSARPSGLLVALAAAAAAAVGLAACGGGNDNGNCHNLAQAVGVIGQQSFKLSVPVTGDVTAHSLGGIAGAASGSTAGGSLLLVSDTSSNRILGYNTIPTGVATDANFVIGQPDFTSSLPGTSATTLRAPGKTWIDPNGQYLVVADTGNNRVLIWTITLPLEGAPSGDPVVVGQPDANSGVANQGLAISLSTLSNPTAAVIANGKLIVADAGNSRVLIWNTVPTTDGTAADVLLGQIANNVGTGNTDQFNNATNTYSLRMNTPSDVWTDGSKLLVADSSNHRVLYWASIPTSLDLLPNTLLGFSKFGEQAPTGLGGASGFNNPFAVTSDGANVFVGDTNNNRVLVFKNYLFSATSGKNADYVYGQATFTNVTNNDPDQNAKVGDQRNDPNTNGVTAGTLFNPQGVYTSGNDIFITDGSNSRVMIYTILNTDGTNFTAVDGSNPHDNDHCF
jgi:hypothetical protein